MYHPNSEIGKAQASRDSEDCPGCGNYKKPGNSFCTDCFFELPKEIQRKLYKDTSSDTYLEALEEAKSLMKEAYKR